MLSLQNYVPYKEIVAHKVYINDLCNVPVYIYNMYAYRSDDEFNSMQMKSV